MLSSNTGAVVPKQDKSKKPVSFFFFFLERDGGLHGAGSVLFHWSCSQPLRKKGRVKRVAMQSCAKNYNVHSFEC